MSLAVETSGFHPLPAVTKPVRTWRVQVSGRRQWCWCWMRAVWNQSSGEWADAVGGSIWAAVLVLRLVIVTFRFSLWNVSVVTIKVRQINCFLFWVLTPLNVMLSCKIIVLSLWNNLQVAILWMNSVLCNVPSVDYRLQNFCCIYWTKLTILWNFPCAIWSRFDWLWHVRHAHLSVESRIECWHSVCWGIEL